MIRKIKISIYSLVGLLIGCSSNYPYLAVVDKVDLDKYIGKWYEIAAFPQRFQKGCNCSSAEYYKTDKDYIRILNSCRKDSVNGEMKTAEGKAFIVENSNNAKLRVQFFWPFKGDYWIIELADDYSYAVVGHPNREYLWILSRTPKMNDSIYQMLLEKIKAKGFDITKLKRTVQECG
jgi:apolipoprotein D and lipocalin family protein